MFQGQTATFSFSLAEWIISGQFVTFAGIAWRVLRRLNRDEDLRKDFPPHRHLEGRVIYPREYTPARTERLDV